MAPGHQETSIPITVIGTVIQQTVILCPTKQTREITNNKQEPYKFYKNSLLLKQQYTSVIKSIQSIFKQKLLRYI